MYEVDYIRTAAANAEVKNRPTVCVYKPEKVVGLMSWYRGDDEGEGYVANLTMLPGYEREGTILVEYAVKLSEDAGYQGRTYFDPFVARGWRYNPPWLKCLKSANVDPQEEKDVWDKLDGVWRLKGQKKSFPGRTTKSARNIHSPNSV